MLSKLAKFEKGYIPRRKILPKKERKNVKGIATDLPSMIG
jgi:hypothetical protein